MTKTQTPAAVVTVPAPKKTGPARKKTGTPAAEAKKAQTAAKAAALDLTPEQLVKRLTTIRTSNDTTTVQVEEFRNMFEAAKLQASNQRVLLARNAYLLATHPTIATKRYPVFYGGAAKAIAGPDATAKEIEALRKWITGHANAGAALEAKGLVWNQGDPTEAERAIVEGSHDAGVRAESAKKNAKVKAKVSKADAETETDDEGGIEKSKVETVIPTAEGIIAALETVRKNVARFNTEARFTDKQVSQIEDLLSQLALELEPLAEDESE